MLICVCVQTSLCIVHVDKGVLDCPEEIPTLPDQDRLLLQLSQKALIHGVKVSDAAHLPHSPDFLPCNKQDGVIEAFRYKGGGVT